MSENIVLDDGERQPCEVWTRVMGYHRPVTSFNKGKQGEYADRVCFEVDERITDEPEDTVSGIA